MHFLCVAKFPWLHVYIPLNNYYSNTWKHILLISAEVEVLEETFYVKEILKERTRSGRKEMLVSWEGFNEEDNTWEPVQNLPPGMVEAFRNRTKQQKRMESSSTQDELLEGTFDANKCSFPGKALMRNTTLGSPWKICQQRWWKPSVTGGRNRRSSQRKVSTICYWRRLTGGRSFQLNQERKEEHLPKRMYKIYLGRTVWGSFLINTQDLKALVSAGKAMRRRNHS